MTTTPEQHCDLVMKGGVTSGVVYPGAIRQIAERFNLIGIGGTSAGALAAVVAAAAEYRRRHGGHMAGYAELDLLADELSSPGRLLSLFRPDPETADLFATALSFLEGRAGTWARIKLFWKLARAGSRKRWLNPLTSNYYGLCTGTALDQRAPQLNEPITLWLTRVIDRVAGMPEGKHLTFEDLHQAPLPAGVDANPINAKRSIDLRMVATSLSFRRPLEFPLDTRIFAFKPKEFRDFFPETVVEQMKNAVKEVDSIGLRQDDALPMPTEKLPVVVAARMSMSFPVLFSMVPLYAVNYHKAEEPLERVWMSDGGITSNFPVHRFDAIYPMWPTLAIGFQEMDPEGKPQRRALLDDSEKRVYLSRDRKDGTLDLWAHFEQENPVSSLLGLLRVIFGSAQNWHDNAYLKLPGFRDRFAEIWLKQTEGGMNLDMDPETVRLLQELGPIAGNELVQRFAVAPPIDDMSWTGHRWTRFRAGMFAMAEELSQLGKDLTDDDGNLVPELADFLNGNQDPPNYRFGSNAEREAALGFTRALLEMTKHARQLSPEPFAKGPRPPLDLGTRAPF